MTIRYKRLIKRIPISFGTEGHCREFSAPDDVIERDGGCIMVTRGEETVDFGLEEVVAAYGRSQHPVIQPMSAIYGDTPWEEPKPTPDQKFAHLAPKQEPVQTAPEESSHAVEKGEGPKGPVGEHRGAGAEQPEPPHQAGRRNRVR